MPRVPFWKIIISPTEESVAFWSQGPPESPSSVVSHGESLHSVVTILEPQASILQLGARHRRRRLEGGNGREDGVVWTTGAGDTLNEAHRIDAMYF